jgi:MFS family permease
MDQKPYRVVRRFGRTQKLLFLICGGGWAVTLALASSIGVLINELHEDWGTSLTVLSSLPVCNLCGIFLGSYVWGMVADRYGRMAVFKTAMIVCAFATAASALAVNIYMLVPALFVVGFGEAGSMAVDGTVFLEYCPAEKTHYLTGMSIVCSFGLIYASGFAWLFTFLHWSMMWRLLLGVNVLFNLLIVFPRFSIKETPQFLHSKGRFEELDALLSTLNGPTGLFSPINESFAPSETEILELTISEQITVLFSRPLKKVILVYLLVKKT